MMEEASSSKMLVNFYQTTWRNIPEDRRLHACCCENLKSHIWMDTFIKTSYV
jgi:hypothetical protein